MSGKSRFFAAAFTLALSSVMVALARLTGLVHSIWPMTIGMLAGTAIFQTLGVVFDRWHENRKLNGK